MRKKLTESDRQEIKRILDSNLPERGRYGSGLTKRLAEQFGVSPSTISKISTGFRRVKDWI